MVAVGTGIENTDAFTHEFRGVMGQIPTSVSVLIAAVDGDLRAMTVGSIVLASFHPPLVAAFVSRESSMHDHFLRATRFTISVLEAGDSLVARRFGRANRQREWMRLEAAQIVEREVGPPVLRGAVSWLDCEVNQVTEVGDHSCFVGKVLEMGRRQGALPLIYYRGRFHGLGASVSPGMHLSADSGEISTSW